ncbi:hypothetical protein E2562_006580 [Oryza meyeriana var. granulata]|uniref:Uncharacterized protein n=1 Tax=Oryza meyeriana var. granulata TaxID=110450 RepID=A0A6G1EES8_9ORYZ|nr:hypothetical protein E2562_006580 [Oryza meyeriana var. granulata]
MWVSLVFSMRLPGDMLAYARRRLDGPSLAATSYTTAGLRALAEDPETATSPRRLFVNAFPFPCVDAAAATLDGDDQRPLLGEIVSAVDVYHRGAGIVSRNVETSTSSSWFLPSPFCVDAVECKNPVTTACDGGVDKVALKAGGFRPGNGDPGGEDAKELPKAREEIRPFPAQPETAIPIEEEALASTTTIPFLPPRGSRRVGVLHMGKELAGHVQRMWIAPAQAHWACLVPRTSY